MSQYAQQPSQPSGSRDLRLDDPDRRTSTGEHGDRPVPPGPLLFLLCFVLFVAGLWGMGLGYDEANGLLFSGGLLACSLAFVIPLQARG